MVRLEVSWASQAPAPPVPWKICTNRTPRSTSRRAARQCRPNSREASLVEAVEPMRLRGLGLQMDHLGNGRLHAEGQLVRLDPCARAPDRRDT